MFVEDDVLNQEQKDAVIKNATYWMEGFMGALGLEVGSVHLKDSPERISKMYVQEIFSGLYDPQPKFTMFPNDHNSNEIVFLGDIDLHSVCSHHFKAFSGKAHIAYLPKRKLVGISKLARITDWFARRPQVQENLNAEIADFLMEELSPEGVAVHISAVHNCIRTRGAKQSSSVMKTTALRGCFKENKTMVDEFMWMISQL